MIRCGCGSSLSCCSCVSAIGFSEARIMYNVFPKMTIGTSAVQAFRFPNINLRASIMSNVRCWRTVSASQPSALRNHVENNGFVLLEVLEVAHNGRFHE